MRVSVASVGGNDVLSRTNRCPINFNPLSFDPINFNHLIFDLMCLGDGVVALDVVLGRLMCYQGIACLMRCVSSEQCRPVRFLFASGLRPPWPLRELVVRGAIERFSAAMGCCDLFTGPRSLIREV